MLDLHEGVRELFLDAQTRTIEAVYSAVATCLAREAASDVEANRTYRWAHRKKVAAMRQNYRNERRAELSAKELARYYAKRDSILAARRAKRAAK